MKKPTKRGVAKVLRKAARLIDEHGWTICRLGNKEVGFCALGAIYSAGEGEENHKMAAKAALSKTIPHGIVVRWNDTATKEAVVCRLRKVARDLEHGGSL